MVKEQEKQTVYALVVNALFGSSGRCMLIIGSNGAAGADGFVSNNVVYCSGGHEDMRMGGAVGRFCA